MIGLRTLFVRTRNRIAYPTLALAMGLTALVAGFEHGSFLVHATLPQTAATTAVASGPDDASSYSLISANEPAMMSFEQSLSAGLDVSYDHRSIDEWVARLTTSLRGDFTNSLTRMDRYAKMITDKLDARQMPRELIYLAMIESNFDTNARSRVGAVGLWQFMSTTARQLGLTVKGRTDERKNPADATDAALTYLSDLHTRFGSWFLAAAAYNSGAGRVSKALMKVTGKTWGTDEDFFRILPSLPRETQDYVPKLIASARVGSNPSDYGL
jgi:membrane-bound lytic murein transglycosylase D